MNGANEYAAYYLEPLRQGHTEDAFFGSIDGNEIRLPSRFGPIDSSA
jgi:hypothetical protein